MRITTLVLLAAYGAAAHAAPTLSFEPANPTPADTIVVTIRDSSPTCAYIIPTSTRFVPPNEIRLSFGHIGDCEFAPFAESKATLGRLPPGSYSVTLAVAFDGVPPPPIDTKMLQVSLPPGAGGPNATAPLDSTSGHYLTGQTGEGVFIEHFGDKSFLTFATYTAEGQPTWLVMPDARWGYNTLRGRLEFAGSIYRARRGQESPPSLTATTAGTGAWYPAGFDTAMLEVTIDGTLQTRTLRRFRF